MSSDGYNKQKMIQVVTINDIYTHNNLFQYDLHY